ncbi:hypothetical protein CLOP_g12504 [Closterium sp. NIES-67]|nr:hypothetical protein CLOP_g12504 [Closterium sp. NIES-67]
MTAADGPLFRSDAWEQLSRPPALSAAEHAKWSMMRRPSTSSGRLGGEGGGGASGGGGGGGGNGSATSILASLVPEHFTCPLSADIMRDPVIIASGLTYERSFIEQWFAEGHMTCPKTRQRVDHTNLCPNVAVKKMITDWCLANRITLAPLEPPPSLDAVRGYGGEGHGRGGGSSGSGRRPPSAKSSADRQRSRGEGRSGTRTAEAGGEQGEVRRMERRNSYDQETEDGARRERKVKGKMKEARESRETRDGRDTREGEEKEGRGLRDSREVEREGRGAGERERGEKGGAGVKGKERSSKSSVKKKGGTDKKEADETEHGHEKGRGVAGQGQGRTQGGNDRDRHHDTWSDSEEQDQDEEQHADVAGRKKGKGAAGKTATSTPVKVRKSVGRNASWSEHPAQLVDSGGSRVEALLSAGREAYEGSSEGTGRRLKERAERAEKGVGARGGATSLGTTPEHPKRGILKGGSTREFGSSRSIASAAVSAAAAGADASPMRMRRGARGGSLSGRHDVFDDSGGFENSRKRFGGNEVDITVAAAAVAGVFRERAAPVSPRGEDDSEEEGEGGGQDRWEGGSAGSGRQKVVFDSGRRGGNEARGDGERDGDGGSIGGQMSGVHLGSGGAQTGGVNMEALAHVKVTRKERARLMELAAQQGGGSSVGGAGSSSGRFSAAVLGLDLTPGPGSHDENGGGSGGGSTGGDLPSGPPSPHAVPQWRNLLVVRTPMASASSSPIMSRQGSQRESASGGTAGAGGGFGVSVQALRARVMELGTGSAGDLGGGGGGGVGEGGAAEGERRLGEHSRTKTWGGAALAALQGEAGGGGKVSQEEGGRSSSGRGSHRGNNGGEGGEGGGGGGEKSRRRRAGTGTWELEADAVSGQGRYAESTGRSRDRERDGERHREREREMERERERESGEHGEPEVIPERDLRALGKSGSQREQRSGRMSDIPPHELLLMQQSQQHAPTAQGRSPPLSRPPRNSPNAPAAPYSAPFGEPRNLSRLSSPPVPRPHSPFFSPAGRSGSGLGGSGLSASQDDLSAALDRTGAGGSGRWSGRGGGEGGEVGGSGRHGGAGGGSGRHHLSSNLDRSMSSVPPGLLRGWGVTEDGGGRGSSGNTVGMVSGNGAGPTEEKERLLGRGRSLREQQAEGKVDQRGFEPPPPRAAGRRSLELERTRTVGGSGKERYVSATFGSVVRPASADSHRRNRSVGWNLLDPLANPGGTTAAGVGAGLEGTGAGGGGGGGGGGRARDPWQRPSTPERRSMDRGGAGLVGGSARRAGGDISSTDGAAGGAGDPGFDSEELATQLAARFSQLAEDLRSGSRSRRVAAARTVRIDVKGQAEAGIDIARKQLVRAGVIKALVAVIKREGGEGEGEEDRGKGGGGGESAARLEEIDQVAAAILTLALHWSAAPDLARAGTIPALVQVLKQGAQSAKAAAAATLYVLAKEDDFRGAVRQSGAVPLLLKVIQEGTPRGRKDAALALFAISLSTRGAKDVVSTGAIPVLLDVIGQEEELPGLEEKAVAVLLNLSRLPEGCEEIEKSDGMMRMVDLLDEGASERSREDAAAVLLAMVKMEIVTVKDLLAEGMLPSLVRVAAGGGSESKAAGAAAGGNVAPEAKELLEMLRKGGKEGGKEG